MRRLGLDAVVERLIMRERGPQNYYSTLLELVEELELDGLLTERARCWCYRVRVRVRKTGCLPSGHACAAHSSGVRPWLAVVGLTTRLFASAKPCLASTST